MVEVFKTNVDNMEQSELLAQELRYRFPGGNISFDLEDCDRVLRISAGDVCCRSVVGILNRYGYHAEVME